VDTSLDGNATGGALGDLFGFDVTVAVSTCATCGDPRAVAELRAYLDAPGIVLRCASCGAPQLRLVRSADRAWLDLRGIQVLEVRGAGIAEPPGPS
jgi:ribosomal protein L37E